MSGPTFEPGMSEGDTVRMSVSHCTKYMGEEFWHSTELTTRIREGESALDAAIRLDAQLQDLSVRGIKSTCRTLDQITSN